MRIGLLRTSSGARFARLDGPLARALDDAPWLRRRETAAAWAWSEADLDPAAQRVRCRVGGQTRQDGATAQMLFDVPTVVSFVSHMMTLEPGDVILTGTPEGVGPLAAGDALEVEVSGVGVLKL